MPKVYGQFVLDIVQTLYKHSKPNIFAMSFHTEHTLKAYASLSRLKWYSSTLGTIIYFMELDEISNLLSWRQSGHYHWIEAFCSIYQRQRVDF